MRTSRPLIAALALGIAGAVATAPAFAAPAPVAKAKAAKAKAAKAKVITQIRTQNRAYAVQRGQVTVCARPNSGASVALRTKAKRTLTTSARLRATALRGTNTRAAQRALVAKRTQMTRATAQLRAVARQCAAARATIGAPAATTLPATPGTAGTDGASGGRGSTGTPGGQGAPGAPGTPGGPGTPGSPGTPGTPGTPGSSATVLGLDLSLADLLGGAPVDLSGVLGPDGVLPSTLTLVGLDGLTDGVLGPDGLIALDPQALLNLINTAVYDISTCPVLDLGCLLGSVFTTVNGALTGVTTILDGVADGTDLAGLDDLLRVERLSDTVIRVVPIGQLAELLTAVGGVDALLAGLAGDTQLTSLLRLP